MDRLPYELLTSVLAHTHPSSHLAAAFAINDPVVELSWIRSLMATRTTRYQDDPFRYAPSSILCGLPTPATSLMKHYIADFRLYLDRRPHPFSAHGSVTNFLLAPHQLAWCSDQGALDYSLGQWLAPIITYNPDLEYQQFSISAAQEALFTLPHLRVVPEVLQLPLLHLHCHDSEGFETVVRRLVAGVPHLITHQRPLVQWIRLALDDQAPVAVEQEQWDPPILAATHTTLPYFWALVAVSEGLLSSLEILVEVAGVDRAELTRMLSDPWLTRIFFLPVLGLKYGNAGRVLPMWRWLRDVRYVYPAAACGLLVAQSHDHSDYDTVRVMALEHDLPYILALDDDDDHQGVRTDHLNTVLRSISPYAGDGHFDLLPVIASAGMVSASTVGTFMRYAVRNVFGTDVDRVFPIIVAASDSIIGGIEEVILLGLCGDTHQQRTTLRFAHYALPRRLPQILAANVATPGLIEVLLDQDQVRQSIDLSFLWHAVLRRRTRGYIMGVPGEESVGYARIVLYGISGRGSLGHAVQDSLKRMTAAEKFKLFQFTVRLLPSLKLADFNDEDPVHHEEGAVTGWPAWQVALDSLLPPLLPTPTESDLITPQPNLDLDLDPAIAAWTERATAEWTVPAPEEHGIVRRPDPWHDPATALAAASLPIDPRRRGQLVTYWTVARIATLEPAAVLTRARFRATTPLWVWQLQIDHARECPVRTAALPVKINLAIMAAMRGGASAEKMTAMLKVLRLAELTVEPVESDVIVFEKWRDEDKLEARKKNMERRPAFKVDWKAVRVIVARSPSVLTAVRKAGVLLYE
ncbi:hypothetical protein BC828DRAFT_387579 [Blastocladiella britannica]|nr:hypothetical protein BC828DRAFT_387579 [Blastocladiella britannica]